MKKSEANLLQAVYANESQPGEWRSYSFESLRWLDKKSLKEVRSWKNEDGSFKTTTGYDLYNQGQIDRINPRYEVTKWTSYLSQKGYINSNIRSENLISISLTAEGVDMARMCSSMFGRLEILYQNNKDGLLGLFITVLAAIITSLITTLATK
jgi:hypothetical protein